MSLSSTIRSRLGALWPTTSLRTYLIAVILLATLPISSLMCYWILTDVQGEQRHLQMELQDAANTLSGSVEHELAASIDALTALANLAVIQRDDIAGFEQTLRSGGGLRSTWVSAYLIDSNGTLLFDTSTSPAGQPGMKPATPPFSPPLFRSATTGRVPATVPIERAAQISNLIDGRIAGQRATAIEVPVVIDGTPRYSVGAWIAAPTWLGIAQEARMPRGAIAGIYGRDRTLIARALPNTTSNARPRAGTVAPDKPASSAGVRRHDDGTRFEAWKTVALAGWGVNVAIAAEPLTPRRNMAISAALATAAACVLLGVLLALWMTDRLARPLQQMATNPRAHADERIVVREVAQLRNALLDARKLEETVRARLKARRDLLQAKANEFETLFENSPIGLAFAQDTKCQEVLYNAAMTTLFGPPPGKAATPAQLLRQGRPLEWHEQPLQRAAALGESVRGMELELVVGDAPPKFVLFSAAPLCGSDGRPRGALGAVVDITKRKQAETRLDRAERSLRESQRLIDLAQEAGNVGFFHYQFASDSLAWTPGLSRLFGMEAVARESTLNDFLAYIVAPDRERTENALRRACERLQEKEELEFRIVPPDGERRWLTSRIMVTYGNDGQPLEMTGITLDTNDQKEAERGRAAAIQREYAARIEAETANRAKDEFLAMLGHELRNPLSAVAAAIEVLNRVDATSDTAANARSIISRQTHHLARLMDDLLDVARVISGKILLSRRRINLAPLVDRLVSTLKLTGSTDQHELKVELKDKWIDADPIRIEQVINNLLTNALKYTPAGGRVEISVGGEGDQAIIEVRDNGVGIPPSLLPRIFDLFVQAERTLDRRAGGLGIGLTLVRHLVELHGGRVTASSSPAGTLFTVHLPAVEPPADLAEYLPAPSSHRRRIGVIEDNEDALDSLCKMLELDGHSVWGAKDGIGGLACLLEHRPDVAVVDIGLPGLTGLEVARRSRAAGYAGRMIALSGYSPDNSDQQVMAAGFDAYLVKPVNADSLRRLLDEQ